MTAVRLVFCERSGDWAAAYRRWAQAELAAARHDRLGRPATGAPPLAGWRVPVAETRTPAECRSWLAKNPHSILAIELRPTGYEGGLDLLIDCLRQPTNPVCAVLGMDLPPELAELARELGAVHVIPARRHLPQLAAIITRRIEREVPAALNVAAQIWDSLPWGTSPATTSTPP